MVSTFYAKKAFGCQHSISNSVRYLIERLKNKGEKCLGVNIEC